MFVICLPCFSFYILLYLVVIISDFCCDFIDYIALQITENDEILLLTMKLLLVYRYFDYSLICSLVKLLLCEVSISENEHDILLLPTY